MPDAPDIVLCSKLCRHDPIDPTWACQEPCKCQECKCEKDHRERPYLNNIETPGD